MNERPGAFDPGLQHERTALAWERTAVAIMVAGVIFARYAAEASWALAFAGLAQVAFGGGVLVWAGWHYDGLHGPLRAGEPIVHPRAAGLVGMIAVISTGLALVVAIVLTVVH